jgi:hypothetical protein
MHFKLNKKFEGGLSQGINLLRLMDRKLRNESTRWKS